MSSTMLASKVVNAPKNALQEAASKAVIPFLGRQNG